jgi:hypothetical protein
MSDTYDMVVRKELARWQQKMMRKPTLVNRFSKNMQTKINNWIPEKIHVAVTATIKQLIKAVLFGAKHTTATPLQHASLQQREIEIDKKIDTYKKTAAVEGGITGAGGIILGLADFPVLIGIKLKLLFDIASLYGFDVNDYKERVYLLHIFELSFSSHAHRKTIYLKMTDWENKKQQLPDDINQFDWRNFQQEYRDYIDLVKMAQLIPIIGAPVGIVVNYRLLKKLGTTAMNAYRMRLLEK